MYWIKIVNIFITIHFIEGFEERTQSSNTLRYFSKYKGDSLSSTTFRSASFTPLTCFRCRNCSHVENHTFRVSCPAPNCCYTAHAKNHTRGLFYIIRGCGKWDRVNGCRWTCQHAREDHLWTHPWGLFINCITCNEGDTDDCNGQYYESPLTWNKPPPSLLCYQCRNCNNVTAKTPNVICKFPRCCYTALVTDQPNEEIFAVRGCVSSNKSCFDSCNQIKREHLQAHANGTFTYCMTCNIGDTDECNMNSYNSANVLKSIDIPIAVRCYHCHNCNKVLSTTPTVRCPQPKCCYVALLKDRQMEPSYAVRGCYTQSEDCSQMCASIEKNHLEKHYNGMLSFCMACGETEGHNCNRNTYNSFNTTRKHPIETDDDTYCFSCENCKEVPIDTSKIDCASGCCFLKIVQGISQRGCVSNFSGKCGEYCMNKTDEFCYTCSGNNCNNGRINSDRNEFHAVFKRTSSIKCYECDDCDTVSDEVHKTVDCPDRCCLIFWWTTNKESTVTRKCISLNGNRCQDSCERTREDMRSQDPTGVLRYCEDCMIDKCNYIEVTSNFATPMTLAPHISCYECKDCDGANAKINTTVCMTDCCYSATLQSDGKSSTVRACAQIQPGRSCREYCEGQFKKEHPDGLEKTCAICQTDKCNRVKSIGVIETHISKVNIEIFKCYKCSNCAKISMNTTLCTCKSKCCVTLIKTVNGVTTTRRECAPSKGIPCRHYCAYTATITKVEFCEVCNINKCNRMPVGNVGNETEKSQDIHHLGINCYKCLNCMKITKNTHFELCDDGCCYATNVEHDDGTVVTKRDCAKIIPALTCKQYCAEIKKDHTVAHPVGSVNFTCNSCASEKCNDKDLNHVSLIPVPNPISCYHCIGCYGLNNKTAEKIECPDNCCYTAIWSEYGNTIMARLCAFLDGERCSNFCSFLTKRLQKNSRTGILHHCRTCCSHNCNSNPLPQPDATFKPGHDVINCYDCKSCDKVSNKTNIVPCLTGCCYLELKRLNDGMRVTNRRCAKILPGTVCNNYCDHIKAVHRVSNRLGAVIYCQGCVAEKCNSQQLDTDEIGIDNKDPINCFECDDCYDLPINKTLLSCETGCCFTVLWTEFSKLHIRRGCLKLIDTPCSTYCQNIERTVKYNDPKGKVAKCEYCLTNECNRLIGRSTEEITPQPFSCYHCSNCTELVIGDSTEPCYNYCCYIYIRKLEDASFVVERGCSETFLWLSCANYCPTTEKDKNITNCVTCSQDLCNTNSFKTEFEKLVKANKKPPPK